jgi:hypothetical protein
MMIALLDLEIQLLDGEWGGANPGRPTLGEHGLSNSYDSCEISAGPQQVSQLRIFFKFLGRTSMNVNETRHARGGPGTGPRATFSGRKRQMSSPVTPIEAPLGSATPPPSPDRGDAARFLAGFSSSEDEISIKAIHSEPPAEVLEEVAAAAELHTEMLEDGREVRFLNDAQGKPVRIELHDRTGLLRTLTVTEAMELVAGASEL